MKLIGSYTLEVLKDRGKYILSIVKVIERGLIHFEGQNEPHLTQRWVDHYHWAAYDSKLSELSANDKLQHLKGCLSLKLLDSVCVKIEKSRIPIEYLCGIITDMNIVPNDVVIVIECRIEHIDSDKENFSSEDFVVGTPSKLCQSKKRIEKDELHNVNTCSRREPIYSKSQNEQLNQKHGSPRKEKHSNDTKTEQKKHKILPRKREEKVSPSKDKNQQNQERSSRQKTRKENKRTTKDLFQNEKIAMDTLSCTEEEDENHQNRVSPGTKRSHESPVRVDKRKKTSIDTPNKNSNGYSEKAEWQDLVDSSSDSSSEPNERKNFNKALAVLNNNTEKSNKRSRSSEQKALRGDLLNSQEFLKDVEAQRQKDNSKNTTNFPKYSVISLSKKKKLININSESPEARSINKWLSKTKPNLSSEDKSNRLVESGNTDSLIKSTEAESKRKDEIEIIFNSSQEERGEHIERAKAQKNFNRDLVKFLKDSTPKSPKKIKNLDLTQLRTEEILNTFAEYHSQLDNLFNLFKYKKKPNQNNGVDHFLVMNLLSNITQLQMMDTLSGRYENIKAGIPKYGELFSMVLMPEWILNIFMKHFNMSRGNAIKHIKAQNDYKIHKESEIQLDESVFSKN